MGIVIIKYNAGNVFSVKCALHRIGVDAVITDDKEIIMNADKVIFPGVGEASTAMAYLRQHRMDEMIKSLTQPVLGICIGMQLLCKHSQEGNTDCLGIFDTMVMRFDNSNTPLNKIPHMGWNTIEVMPNELVDASFDNKFVYFVHSYYAPVNKFTVAKSSYINEFSSILKKDNFYATQFHPEKSGTIGEQILKNFIGL